MDETMALRNQPEHRNTYAAQDARGGEIILRTRTERIIFVGGLAAAMTLGVVVVIVGFWLQG